MNLSHNPVSPDRSADLRSGASLMIGNPPGRRPVCGRSADSLVRKFLSSGSRGLSGPRSGSVAQSAFSLVEIMIAVTLMSVIVLGLTAMFTQTQRAFRLGMNQSDVLEAGRIATDMIVREMETMVPVNRTNITPAFYSELESINNTSVLPLPGTPEGRTNWMSDVFFLKRENQTLTGVGYFVRTNADVPDSYDPVGSLYRYETNCSPWMFDQNPYRLSEGFYKARFVSPPIRSSKVVDGVVHFSVKAYDTNGVWIRPVPFNQNTNILGTNIMNNAFWSLRYPTPLVSQQTDYFFTNNAVPAFVELEIGILEQQTYERYKAIPVYQAKTNFLNKHAGNIHIFRQRIPVRNVDVTAYQ